MSSNFVRVRFVDTLIIGIRLEIQRDVALSLEEKNWMLRISKIKFDLPQLLNHVDTQTLKHLPNHLIRALDEDLYRPPIILSHVPQKPLASSSARNKLLSQQLHPLHHHRLRERKFNL